MSDAPSVECLEAEYMRERKPAHEGGHMLRRVRQLERERDEARESAEDFRDYHNPGKRLPWEPDV